MCCFVPLNKNNEVVQMIHLNENLSGGDERGAELCGKQTADEEIPQSSSEELQITHSYNPYHTC